MIRLNSNAIKEDSKKYLELLSLQIQQEKDFDKKVLLAQDLWDKKNNGNGKDVFNNVKENLAPRMNGLCCFCENDRSTDIEHFYPKSLYPEKTFSYENYAYSCKPCNTKKGVSFHVFKDVVTNASEKISQKKKPPYTKPVNTDCALINIRIENPLNFLILIQTGDNLLFQANSIDSSSRESIKAKNTISLFDLNSINKQDVLGRARFQALKYYYDRLEKYVKVKTATEYSDIIPHLGDADTIDTSLPFTISQTQKLNSIKNDILTYHHPTVWEELKLRRMGINFTKTNNLFANAPEALQW